MKKYETLSIEQLKEIIQTSLSKKEVCIKIGYKSGTKYNTIVNEISDKNNTLYCLIECQGHEHQIPVSFWGGEEKFKKRIKYDKLKKDYCFLHKIPLYYIPYQDYNKIDKQYLYNLLNKMEG